MDARFFWPQRMRPLLAMCLLTVLLLLTSAASAIELRSVDVVTLPQEQAEILMTFSAPIEPPLAFALELPDRLVVELNGVTSFDLPSNQSLEQGLVESVSAATAGDRTRVVMRLRQRVELQTEHRGAQFSLRLTPHSAVSAAETTLPPQGGAQSADAIMPSDSEPTPGISAPTAPAAVSPVDQTPASAPVVAPATAPTPAVAESMPQPRVPTPAQSTAGQIIDIDFKLGPEAQAQLILTLNRSDFSFDIRRDLNDLVVEVFDMELPERLQRRLDVMDFATPVQFVDTVRARDPATVMLQTNGVIEHLAYQLENQLIIEVKPATPTGAEAFESLYEKQYSGEKLSLNFQNIEVRAVLQLLADFTELNLVTSDTVTGNVTLRLRNVPWDQALDIILQTKGLAMRQNGSVLLVAPAAEIAAREKEELEARNQLTQLEPLFSDFIEINFAKATDIADILRFSPATTQGTRTEGFLSERGTVVVDERTNALLIRDTATQLREIRALIQRLDIPVRQVLIESRVVIASNDFTRELGVRFGASASSRTLGAATDGSASGLSVSPNNRNLILPSRQPGTTLGSESNLNVNLPVANPAGTVALALAKLPLGMILELELSAMQEEGKGEIISSPRVITSNQRQAVIEQGTEIPFQEATSSGATSVSFKQATLRLEVTPQITPDDRVIMDLQVNKDEVGSREFLGVPSVDTRSVRTQVLVDNGETVVLGGIYEQESRNLVTRVPFFSDLPVIGRAFRNSNNIDNQRELLVFVTPKIIKDDLTR